MSLKNVLNALGDAVRNLTGGTSALSLEGMTSVLNNIVKRSSSDLTASGATVDVPAGYYASAASKAVATATQATPTISVDSTGKITASAEQSAGYVAAGTKSATKQLTTQAAQTITPGTSNKTVASGVYLTGEQTIEGDANLVAANIKKGVSIFNVVGTLEESSGGGALVLKNGTTTTASFDTGLSEIVAIIIERDSITSEGLATAAYIPAAGIVNYGGCSSYSTYMISYRVGCFATSEYCEVDGGTFKWVTTASSITFNEGQSHTWYALGYE